MLSTGTDAGRPLLEAPCTLDQTSLSQPIEIVTGGDEAPWINRKASDRASRAARARAASPRRHQGDPATSERDYSGPEIEFMNAMQEYKKRSGRLFPTWSEVLEVLTSLGYSKAGVSLAE